MQTKTMAAGAATIGAAMLLVTPATASAASSADLSDVSDALAAGSSNIPGALPDVDVHLNVDELTAAADGGTTAVTFAPPQMPVNTTCYGPYVYTGRLDSKIKDIAGRFMDQQKQDGSDGADVGDGTGNSGGSDGSGGTGNSDGTDGTDGSGSDSGASVRAAADTDAGNAGNAESADEAGTDDAVDEAVGGATDDAASKVSPTEDDPSTRVSPGDSSALSFDLGDGDYTALATCVTGGKVPAGNGTDGADADHPADAAQGVHGTVYLRAIHYDFGVAGQLLGSLDAGSIGSLTDLFS